MSRCIRPSAGPGSTATAGFATRDLTPAIGVPLGGYGGAPRRALPFNVHRRYPHATFFKPSTGVLDPIRAKAFVLARGRHKLLFLSLDVVGITADLHRAIVEGVKSQGFDNDGIFVSATHTHSGPGTLSRDLIWQIVAMDVFRPEIFRQFVAGVVEAVRDADAAAQPADLSAFSFAALGLQRNRHHRSNFYDPTANVLLAKSVESGRWLGAMVNLAIHGTSMQADNLQFSADAPGGIERSLQDRLGAPVLFVNGAEGDVSPIRPGTDGINFIGQHFADQAMAALPAARPIDADWSVHTRVVQLTTPRINPRSFDLLNRLNFTVGLGTLLPRHVPLSVVRLGDMMLLAWPGEPTTSLGFAVKGVAGDAGAAQAWVLGLTNGHLGYFVTPAEYRAGGYEACNSLYGPDAGTQLVDEFRSMLGGL